MSSHVVLNSFNHLYCRVRVIKFAVPTDTAVAPARINSIASLAFAIPPIPIIGTFTALAPDIPFLLPQA